MAAGWHAHGLRRENVAQLWDRAESASSDEPLVALHGRACAQCVGLVFREHAQRLADHARFIDAYAAEVEGREAAAVEPPPSLWASAELEDEAVALAAALAEVEAEGRALHTERVYWDAQEAALRKAQRAQQVVRERWMDEQHLMAVAREDAAAAARVAHERLAVLEQYRVHEDLFAVRQRDHFGTINGLRLGSLPTAPVDWDEINRSVGECCLLLHVCGAKLGHRFRAFRPVPQADCSYMERVSTGEQHPLAGSFRTTFLSSAFNVALGALLAATDELVQTVAKAYGVKAPFRVTNDMVGDAKDNWYSIKRPTSDSPKWVRALLFLLANLKWLLACVCTADSKRGE